MNRIFVFISLLLFSNTALAVDIESLDSQFKEILIKIQAEHEYPGISMAVTYAGTIYTDQIGYSDVSKKKPINSETIFRAYSVTKRLTGILSGILSDDGLVDLNAPIKNYIQGIPEPLENITSQQLLSHRSGIRHYLSNQEWLELSQKHCSSPKDAFEAFVYDPLVSAVDAEEHYSSFGYVLLSGVLESATGKSFSTLMFDYVLNPSKASRIEFDNPGENITPNVSKYYEPENGEYFEAPSIDNSCKFGGGGINSTPSELVKVMRSYFSGKLTNEPASKMVNSLPRRFTTSGEGLGGRSALVGYPKESLSVVLMANARGGNLQPFAIEIAELIISNQ